MSSALQWLNAKMPKIYMLNTNEYPKYEYPRKTGVMHEYPHYMIAGKKVPTGHVAFVSLVGIYALIKVVGMLAGSKKAHSHDKQVVTFPEKKRDWAAEREEFVANYVQAHSHHHK